MRVTESKAGSRNRSREIHPTCSADSSLSLQLPCATRPRAEFARTMTSTQHRPSQSLLAALPPSRRVFVIAQDPTGRNDDGSILMAEIEIPAEELGPGPRGYRVHVIDYDASSGRYMGGHEMPRRMPRSWCKGAPAIVNSPKFRAANAYSLVM